MDEKIDLTDNRDFRDTPKLKNSKIISNHKQNTLSKYVARSLEKIKEEPEYTKKIILNAGSLCIEYDTIDGEMTCHRCGRKFIINGSMLCSKYDAEVSARIDAGLTF